MRGYAHMHKCMCIYHNICVRVEEHIQILYAFLCNCVCPEVHCISVYEETCGKMHVWISYLNYALVYVCLCLYLCKYVAFVHMTVSEK